MDAKLTLRLEKDVIERAKEYARRQGVSLSRLVEHHFREVTQTDRTDDSPKLHGVTAELAGMLEGSYLEDWKQAKSDRLTRKYL